MAKDRKVLQHIHSSIEDKQPTPDSLRVGELAVNNHAKKEFISLKNSNDKVVRFSSDSTIIDWIENKEVIPYKGYVRGETGPSATSGDTPSADAYGSYGITDNDLLTNKSNIIVKINQVAAKNTVKYNKINAAKDRYNKDINPSENTPTGKTDGAGFFIDMSRYAMQGANPTFSGTTNTCYTNLNGTTKIKGVDGACGSLLEITVNSAKTDIETANTEITSATTVIGTNATTISGNTVLNVSGTTTETHDKIVTITNNSGVTETTKGNVVENVSGTTTINHSGTTTTNESANTVFNTTGTTTLNSTGTTTIQSTGNGSDVIVYAKDDLCATSDDVAAFKGTNKTNIGIDCSDAGQTQTLNVRANTADTRVTSAYTSATTATTIINTANTSATTATLSGDTLSIIENDTDIKSCGRISATTNDFEVKQCTANGKVVINSDDIDISGKTLDIIENTSTTIKSPDTSISGDNLTIIENSSTTIKSPETTISGCSKVEIISDDLNLRPCTSAGTIDFNFCNGFSVESNKVSIEQCDANGTLTIKEKATTISGTTLDILEKDEVEIVGDNKVHIGGETVEVACDLFDVDADSNVCIESDDNARFYGANDTKVGVSCTNQLSKNTVINSLSGTVVSSDSDTCIYGRNVNVGGDVRTRIGANCQGEVDSSYVEISATTSITETAPIIELSSSTTNLTSNATNIDAISSVCVSAGTIACFYGKDTRIGMECDRTTIATATTIEGTTLGLSGNTTNISGATTLSLSGKTVNVDATDIDVDASNSYCLSAATNANFYGKTTNIGVDCGGTTATTINVSGTTINEGGTTNNNNFTTINNTATTINNKANFNITGTTYISGNTTIDGNLTIPITCSTITSSTVNDALCEVLSRDAITMTRVDTPSDSRLSATYKLWQNGVQIGYDIDVPKDGFLSNVELVNVNNIYYLRFTWNIYDAESHTYSTGSTDVNVEDLVKDIDDKNPSDTGTAANHNVIVDVHYDATDKKMVVSAETTPTMNVRDLYATRNISGANITASTKVTTKDLDVSGNANITGTTNISGATKIDDNLTVTGKANISGATRIDNNLTVSGNTYLSGTTYGLKDLTIQSGSTSIQSPYNGSEAKTIKIPSDAFHLWRNKLVINYGENVSAKTDTEYDPGAGTTNTMRSGTTVYIPTDVNHINRNTLSFLYGTPDTGKTSYDPGNGTAGTGRSSSVTIPTSTAHLTKSTLTIDYNDVYGKTDTSYDTTAARTITVPDSLANVSHQMVVDDTPANTGGTITIKKKISVSGTITATGAIYSSDRNLKDNIVDIDDNELDKAARVSFKSYNFKGENNKIYGVIAQDLQEIGLNEMVYTKDDGTLAVDYTSLMILEIAKLRRDENSLLEHIAWLERRIEKLESEKKD